MLRSSRGVAFPLTALFVTMCIAEVSFCNSTQTETFTTLRGALNEIAAKYKIQVGLEYAASDKDLQPITLDFSPKNVEAVLAQLANQKRQYAWALNEEVYNIYPRSNPDSILDVKIHDFSISKLSSKDALEQVVGNIPEIREWLRTRKVSRHEFQLGPSTPSSTKLVSMQAKDLTFRVLLNRLIREYEIVDWMVGRYGDKQEYIGIYF